jgi:Zn-dependent protease with chaperone function
MSPPAVLAPLGAIFVLLALSSAVAVALVGRFVPSVKRRWVLRSTALRAAILCAPMILAALGCVALAFPNPFIGCHCAQHGLHHPHLCVSHPAFALPLVAPATIILGVWWLLAALRLHRLGREVLASMRWTRTVRRSRDEQLDGIAFRLIDSASRSAFTIGVLSPVIVFDRLLWDALTIEERRAVLHHEQGHVERRDGLTLLVLRFCLALYPVPIGPRLLDAWRAAAESACDLYAAAKLGDAFAVAGALVSVEKARTQEIVADAAGRAPAFGVAAGGDLERRVIALLDQPEAAPGELPLGNDVLAVSLVALGAGALSLVWPGGSFHHAIETLIGWFIH